MAVGGLTFALYWGYFFEWQSPIPYPEILELRADEELHIARVRNVLAKGENAIWTMQAGEYLKVLACDGNKSTVAFVLEIDVETQGYLVFGKYSIKRRPATVSDLFETPWKYIVFSCGGFYMHRSIEG